MALPDRLTISQLITSLDKLGVKAPAAVIAAHQRLDRITAGAQNIGSPRGALFVAVTAALDQGADPAADPEVQRVLTASQIANAGVTQGVDAIVYDQFRQVCTEHADIILKALAQPFDAAVKTLDRAHKAIGNLPIEDSAAILRKGGDIAKVWGEAQVAVATVDLVITCWQALGEFTHLAPIDRHHAVLRLAAVTYDEWTTHGLRERKVTPWEAILAGLDLNLPTLGEYRDRITFIEQGQRQSLVDQAPIDSERSNIADWAARTTAARAASTV